MGPIMGTRRRGTRGRASARVGMVATGTTIIIIMVCPSACTRMGAVCVCVCACNGVCCAHVLFVYRYVWCKKRVGGGTIAVIAHLNS